MVKLIDYRMEYIEYVWPGYLNFQFQLRLPLGKPAITLVLYFIKPDQ